jgi:hypothetical protein
MSILRDGIQTLVFMSGLPRDLYGEIEVTPPGVTGRGPIDMVGLRQVEWATQAPKSIKNLTPVNAKAMYDPAIIPSVWNLLQINQQIQIQFPNGARLVFWGWLEEMNLDPHSEGNRPTLNWVIQPSNLNTQCVETGPTWQNGNFQPCA